MRRFPNIFLLLVYHEIRRRKRSINYTFVCESWNFDFLRSLWYDNRMIKKYY